MFKNLKKHWRLFWLLRKIHLMRQMEFRFNFMFWMSISTMWTVFNFFFFAVLANIGNGIGSWSVYEVYVLLSVFTMIDALTWSFFYPNMKTYTQMVFSGELNQLLTRPIDTQFLIMVNHNSFTNVLRFFIGVAILKWSLDQLQITPSGVQILIFSCLFLVACLFVYYLWFCLSTLSFWVERLDNINEIIPAFRRIWQVPREVYRGVLSIIFTTLLPVGLVTSIPSEIFLGRSSIDWIIYFCLFTVGIILFSRWFFKVSIKKYSGIAN